MTPRTLSPASDLGRFLTPEALAEVRRRQQAVPEVVAPKDSPLSAERAKRLTDPQWRSAFSRAGRAFVDAIQAHLTTDDGTEISAMILDRTLDLHSYGMTLFASSLPNPQAVFRVKAHEVMVALWADIHRTIRAGLEEAEPLIRAEYQEQLDAAFLMVDGANEETTRERRRADAADRVLTEAKAQQASELDTALWRAGQTAKGELKAQVRRTEAAERQVGEAQGELTLLRQEVARLSARERDAQERVAVLEAQLAEAQGNLLGLAFQKAGSKNKEDQVAQGPGAVRVDSVLEGLALVRRVRASGGDALLDPETRTVRSEGVGDAALAEYLRACQGIGDKAGHLRAHLVAEGLVAA